jgi:phosphoglycerate kinase
MIHEKIKSWNLHNKRVFVRADLNVPLEDGKILNDFRLISILPTIDYILGKGGSIVLATHIGRPKDHESDLSTQNLVPWFKQRGYSILFLTNVAEIAQHNVIPKQIILVENLRFFPGEKDGDPFFAKQLASNSDYYVNDAFGIVHESNCSTTLLPYEFPENRRSIGFLMGKELQMLSTLRDNPPHPFVAILGGGKIADKIPLINGLLNTVDTILICPALCFSFLKALGEPVGKSLVDDNMQKLCTEIIDKAHKAGINILFPVDYQVATDSIDGPLSITTATDFPVNAIGISIGPKTVELFTAEINQAKTIFLNCAMGFADRQETRESTYSIIRAMAHTTATTVIAGGDSIDAAFASGSAPSISHLSSGGGAALTYLSGNLLPGLAAFEEE